MTARDLEYHAKHLRKEIDRLLAVAADYAARAEAARGTSSEVGLSHLAEQELSAISRKLQRCQLELVHRSDHRYEAAQNLLRDTATLGRPVSHTTLLEEPAVA